MESNYDKLICIFQYITFAEKEQFVDHLDSTQLTNNINTENNSVWLIICIYILADYLQLINYLTIRGNDISFTSMSFIIRLVQSSIVF